MGTLALSLDLMQRGAGRRGLAVTGCQGAGALGHPLTRTHLLCLLSGDSSLGILIEAEGACAQAGEIGHLHLGLVTGIFSHRGPGHQPLPPADFPGIPEICWDCFCVLMCVALFGAWSPQKECLGWE